MHLVIFCSGSIPSYHDIATNLGRLPIHLTNSTLTETFGIL
jgi:hypothetical protein